MMRSLFLLLTGLLAVSCAVRREASSASSAAVRHTAAAESLSTRVDDSLSQHRDVRHTSSLVESRTLAYAALPSERVTLRLPLARFDSLPSGAAFVAGEGRTRLEARREGDCLLLTASVDSLPRRVEEHRRVERQAVEERDSAGHALRGERLHTLRRDTLRREASQEQLRTEKRRRVPFPLVVLTLAAVAAVVVRWRLGRR